MKRLRKAKPPRTSPPAPLPIGCGEGSAGALLAGHLFLTKPQLAGILQISVRCITDMMKRGELDYLKLRGRFVRFRLEDVQRRLNETALVCNRAPEKEGA